MKTDHLIGYARTEYHCKIVMHIMVIFLMMGPNLLAKDIAIMVFV